MKYVWIALAVVAAIAALFFRPPQIGTPAAFPTAGGTSPEAGRPTSPLGIGPRHVERLVARHVVVYVAGEVRAPGVYTLASNARAQDALARAGGPRSDADLVAVNLAAPVYDGDEIAVPKIGSAIPRRSRASAPRPRASRRPHGRRRRGGSADSPAPIGGSSAPIDLNTAVADQLEAIPGIGPALAARIVAYRAINGPFSSIDELADVSGITPRLQDSLAESVVIR